MKKSIKRILKINQIEDYNIHCLFSNGQARVIDFKVLFDKWNLQKKDIGYPLTQSLQAFQQVKLVDGTLTWPNIGIISTDENGEKVSYTYDLDPIVLYEASEVDLTRKMTFGDQIKQARKAAKLTKKALAIKSGVSKKQVSLAEKGDLSLTLLTLTRIIEVGLEQKMSITFS